MKVPRLTSPLVTTLNCCESIYPIRSVCRRSAAHIRTHAWMFIICCLLFFVGFRFFCFMSISTRQEAAQKLRMAMKFNLMWPKRWQGRVGQMTLSVTANTCLCVCVRLWVCLCVCNCYYSSWVQVCVVVNTRASALSTQEWIDFEWPLEITFLADLQLLKLTKVSILIMFYIKRRENMFRLIILSTISTN